MTAHLQNNVALHPASQLHKFNNLAILRLQQLASEEASKSPSLQQQGIVFV